LFINNSRPDVACCASELSIAELDRGIANKASAEPEKTATTAANLSTELVLRLIDDLEVGFVLAAFQFKRRDRRPD
jgi:hypothetical protein